MKKYLISLLALLVLSGCQKEVIDTPVEPDPPIVVLTEEEKRIIRANEILESMSLSEKIYQLFIIAPEQLGSYSAVKSTNDKLLEDFKNQPVGGFILFASNINNPDQTTALISTLQANSKLGLFMAVDEEGGVVRRIGSNSNFPVTQIGNMRNYSSIPEVYNATYTIGTDIKQYGFNVDFAPVADTLAKGYSGILYYRSFGSDPVKTSFFVKAAVLGFKDANIICSLKHFPNHGATTADSHFGSAISNSDKDTLYNFDLLPFIAGIEAGVDMIMVGHISLPKVTGDYLPASLSKQLMNDLLREELGYKGIIITDSCRMQAITSQVNSYEVGVKVLEAGGDIILMPNSLSAAYNGILEAVNSQQISEERIDESVLRILLLKLEKGIIQ